MGIIRNAEKAPTNILYKIDDMTAAPMDVRQWVDTDVSVFLVWKYISKTLKVKKKQKPQNENLIDLAT